MVIFSNKLLKIEQEIIQKIYSLSWHFKNWRKYFPNLVSYKPNIKKVEIEITTACNLHCLNCDRSCRQAPNNECMSIEQIKKFVEESIKLNWKWKSIGLIGGEPTLHPQFFEILKIIKRYKDINPKCKIILFTNGFGDKVNKILSKLPNWVRVENSKKNSPTNKFSSYNVAQIDLDEYKNADFSKGCEVIERCGLGLSRYGYYPCGAGASADRVFGFNIGIKKLSLINEYALRNQLKLLCKICGHYKHKHNRKLPKVKQEKISPTWKKAYEKYKTRKPSLSLY